MVVCTRPQSYRIANLIANYLVEQAEAEIRCIRAPLIDDNLQRWGAARLRPASTRPLLASLALAVRCRDRAATFPTVPVRAAMRASPPSSLTPRPRRAWRLGSCRQSWKASSRSGSSSTLTTCATCASCRTTCASATSSSSCRAPVCSRGPTASSSCASPSRRGSPSSAFRSPAPTRTTSPPRRRCSRTWTRSSSSSTQAPPSC